MTRSRADAAAGVINGIIYVAGGYSFEAGGGPLASVEAYDPATNTWTIKTPMPAARYSAATAVINGILYVAGGRDLNDDSLSTMVAFDPATNEWTSKPSMSKARQGAAGGNRAGQFHVVGGDFDSLEVYNPGTNSWQRRKGVGAGFYPGTSAAVLGDVFYVVFGPASADPTDYTLLGFSGGADWFGAATSDPDFLRESAGAAAKGKVFFAGGLNADFNPVKDVRSYDPVTHKWATLANLPEARYGASAVTVDDVIYVIGGVAGDEGNSTARTIYSFKP